MADDDIEMIETNDEESGKPLLLLFKRLIGNNRPEQNTVLSNQQIIQILKEEFDIKVEDLHDLEVDIYLSVMKRFLKEWPQWDEFDRTVSRLRSKNDKAGIQQLLEVKTKHLKEYIKTMLEIASSMAKEAVKDAEKRKEEKSKKNSNLASKDDDVVLEIACTRSQLNKLIINQPGRDSVFNIADETPSTISLASISIQTVLNWWCFNVYICLPSLCYRRETVHELKHVLVNKKIKQPTKWTELDTCLQEKTVVKTTDITKNQLFDYLDRISKSLPNPSMIRIFDIIVNLMKQDLYYSPEILKLHAMYRRYMNKYPYVRYLYTDVKGANDCDANKYDLQLEETITPMYQLHLLKLELSRISEPPRECDVIYIECRMCNLKFNGGQLNEVHQHFIDFHQNEPDWQCTNCKNKFTMVELAQKRWFHNC